tara:strand:+ start:160 stop:540 length:381 start_codon:yes stop_codon:yes gene_type:complete
MKKLVIVLTAVILGISCTTQDTKTEAHEKVDVKTFLDGLKSNSKNILLIDVRTPGEFNNGNIKNAINLNYYDSNFQQQISKLDTSKIAYIYCKLGGRSNKAAKVLISSGFKKVVDLSGGFNAYSNQ